MEFFSQEFNKKIVPFSEKLIELLLKNASNCIYWDEVNKEFKINDDEIKKFSENLIQNDSSKTDIIQSIILVAINIENNSQNNIIINKIKDQSILILCMSSLYMVRNGHFDIVFWLDIILDISCLLKRDGLITLIRWIYNFIDIFDWSISNPNIPYNKIDEFKQSNSNELNPINSQNENSPSIAAQRQLAHAKFVGLLKIIGRRLIGYGDYKEAGMLRSLVFTILPSNQAGICRKTFVTKNNFSYNLKEIIDNNDTKSPIIKEEPIIDNNIDKEEGEMINDKDEHSELENNDFQYLLKPGNYIQNIFNSLNNVDYFLQNPIDFLGILNENNNLSSNKKKMIDNICKDIDIIISHFEDYKSIDLRINESNIKSKYYNDLDKNNKIINNKTNIHFSRLDSILEGIPSSLESIYFRINFAYRLSFVICNQFSQIVDNYKSISEYIINKMTPLLQRCLCCIEKYNKEMNFSTILFINKMIQYELFWLSWKNNNCVEISYLNKEILDNFDRINDDENDTKKRRIEKELIVTKFAKDEIFNKYINFVEKIFDLNCRNINICELNNSYLKDINKPNFSTERELLYLSPREDDKDIEKSVNKKILDKFNDYNEKILLDLNPENGIEESEKSIKESLFRWRCDRLYKRFRLFDIDSLDLVKLSVNNLEDYLNDFKNSSYPNENELEFLNMFDLKENI